MPNPPKGNFIVQIRLNPTDLRFLDQEAVRTGTDRSKVIRGLLRDRAANQGETVPFSYGTFR